MADFLGADSRAQVERFNVGEDPVPVTRAMQAAIVAARAESGDWDEVRRRAEAWGHSAASLARLWASLVSYDAQLLVPPVEEPDGRVVGVRRAKGAPFTARDDAALIDARVRNLSWKATGLLLGRPPSSCKQRWVRGS